MRAADTAVFECASYRCTALPNWLENVLQIIGSSAGWDFVSPVAINFHLVKWDFFCFFFFTNFNINQHCGRAVLCAEKTYGDNIAGICGKHDSVGRPQRTKQRELSYVFWFELLKHKQRLNEVRMLCLQMFTDPKTIRDCPVYYDCGLL